MAAQCIARRHNDTTYTLKFTTLQAPIVTLLSESDCPRQTMAQPQPAGPFFRLVTVNTAPDRARRLIGRVVEDVKDR